MKHIDAVMRELWKAKDANTKRHRTVGAYLAFLRKQDGQTPAGFGGTKLSSPRRNRTKAAATP